MKKLSPIQLVRQQNLRLLVIEKFGGKRAPLARQIDTPQNHVNLLLTENAIHLRAMGEGLARKVEEKLGLDIGWMDAPHRKVNGADESITVAARTIPAEFRDILRECQVSRYAIHRAWLESLAHRIENLSELFIATLVAPVASQDVHPGSVVLVDAGVRQVGSEGLYILATGSEHCVARRIRRNLNGGFVLKPMDAAGPDVVLDSSDKPRVVGRIVAHIPLPRPLV